MDKRKPKKGFFRPQLNMHIDISQRPLWWHSEVRGGGIESGPEKRGQNEGTEPRYTQKLNSRTQ